MVMARRGAPVAQHLPDLRLRLPAAPAKVCSNVAPIRYYRVTTKASARYQAAEEPQSAPHAT